MHNTDSHDQLISIGDSISYTDVVCGGKGDIDTTQFRIFLLFKKGNNMELIYYVEIIYYLSWLFCFSSEGAMCCIIVEFSFSV